MWWKKGAKENYMKNEKDRKEEKKSARDRETTRNKRKG